METGQQKSSSETLNYPVWEKPPATNDAFRDVLTVNARQRQEIGRRKAKRSPIGLSRHYWPEEPPAEHSELLLYYLHQVAKKKIPRLMVFMPPGHAKSTYASVRFPAWYMGTFPENNIIHCGHTATLVQRFGRRIRNTLRDPEFFETFGVNLSGESSARGDWTTSKGGEYYACGMDGGITGRRADGVIIDDPVKGRKEADSETIRENAWETYRTELRTRLKKDGWIILIMTRWHEDDLAGRILPEDWNGQTGYVNARDGEEWFVLSLQAIYEEPDAQKIRKEAMTPDQYEDPLGRKPGDALWPSWQSKKALLKEKAIQGTRNWNALYQQHPTTEEGAILKAAYWKEWPLEKPPVCEYVLQSWDTAFEEEEENDCSARTTWGVFNWMDQDIRSLPESFIKEAPKLPYCAIVIDRWMDKEQYVALKPRAMQAYEDFSPDRVLIEKKASGHILLQDMRRAGVPVKPYSPDKSKIARAHAAAVVFQAGCVFHMRRTWADRLIRNCAQFPNGEYDDDVDTVTQAIIYFRKLFHLQIPDDEEDDEMPAKKGKRYYG